MCTVIDFKSGKPAFTNMTIKEAEAIVGEGLMMDELISTKNLCDDDEKIVEACSILIARCS